MPLHTEPMFQCVAVERAHGRTFAYRVTIQLEGRTQMRYARHALVGPICDYFGEYFYTERLRVEGKTLRSRALRYWRIMFREAYLTGDVALGMHALFIKEAVPSKPKDKGEAEFGRYLFTLGRMSGLFNEYPLYETRAPAWVRGEDKKKGVADE